MRANTKAKWIIGITGTAFSAFIISQLDQPKSSDTETFAYTLAAEITDSMSEREKELVQLNWSDFTIQVANGEVKSPANRTTRKTR
jgi:hypothetical protein